MKGDRMVAMRCPDCGFRWNGWLRHRGYPHCCKAMPVISYRLWKISLPGGGRIDAKPTQNCCLWTREGNRVSQCA